jgi:hypothetical protein
MEDEHESIPFPVDPHRQIASYQQDGYLVFLLMDGNQDDTHVFREQEYIGKCCTTLGFHYDKSIDGSIASMVDACDLVNIHKLKHGNTPPTQSSMSIQIYFIFVYAAATEFIEYCGILDYDTIFPSDHISLYIDINIL